MKRVLIYALLVSVACNVYLFYKLVSPVPNESSLSPSVETVNPANLDHSSEYGSVLSAPPSTSANQTINATGLSTVAQIKRWMAAEQFELAQHAINQHLRSFPSDTQVLLLESEIIEQTESVSDALTAYYTLLDYPLSSEQHAEVLQRIRTLSHTNIAKLKSISAWDVLANFLEPLWQHEPLRKNYIVNLAEAYAMQQLEAPMENVLASLPPQDQDAHRIRGLLSKHDDTSNLPQALIEQPRKTYDKAIQLRASGQHFLSPIYVARHKFDLILDTGASTTVITERAFQSLNSKQVDFIGRYNFSTAGGMVDAPVYRLPRLYFAGHKLDDVAVVVLPLDGNAEGLLGMNILSQFDFKLDQQQNMLWLSKR